MTYWDPATSSCQSTGTDTGTGTGTDTDTDVETNYGTDQVTWDATAMPTTFLLPSSPAPAPALNGGDDGDANCTSGEYWDATSLSCVHCPAACNQAQVPAKDAVFKTVVINNTIEVEKIVEVERIVEMPWEKCRLAMLNVAWGRREYSRCELSYTLSELRQRHNANMPTSFKIGGLGTKMRADLFEVWVCVEGHYCAGTSHPMDGWFCWVIDERIAQPVEHAPQQYVAWGHNYDLQLV
jgi:hypothetical protein